MSMQRENPTSVQSKQWILAALLRLMEEKEFRSITITEVTRRAGLDRKTFYRHFHSKEEVLYLKLEELCGLYAEKLWALPCISAYSVSKAYFDICVSEGNFLSLLNRHNLLPLALLKFDEQLPVLNKLFLTNSTYRNKSAYELAYQAGGFWNITIRWLRNGRRESAEELASIMRSIMPSPLKPPFASEE